MKQELRFLKYLSLLSLLLFGMVMFGCKGDNGSAGVSTGVLSGTVTNSLTGTPVAGATITVNPNVEGTHVISTDASGHYSVGLPLTVYSVTIAAPNYTSQTFTDAIFAGQVTTQNAALVPTQNAVVGVAPVTNAAPGQTVTLRAVPAIFNGVTATPTFHWTQISGPPVASFTNVSSASPTIVLASRASYKQSLARTEAPRQSVDPNTQLPIFEPLNRTQVVGLTNEALITGLQATFQVTMTAGSDSATAPVTVTLKPFFAPQTSLRNVPIGQPVLLQGDFYTGNVFNTASKAAATQKSSWTWTMTKPAGSNAALNDATSQYPDFMPDVFGSYSVSETTTGKAFKVYAGTWQTTITGLDTFGDPTADPAARNQNALNAGVLGCGCHYVASDPENGKFTRSWNRSGHSHIVSGLTAHLPGGPTTQNITDPNGHWTPQACGPCHTVGFAQYSSAIKANGFSEIYRLEGLKITKGPNAWTDTIANFPLSASLMQISCQNCHGPTTSPAHTSTLIPGSSPPATNPAPGNDFFARVSFSSDVCGVCHGEPTRHGKWQQWRSSGHGDFETALFEGLTGASATSLGSINPSCGGCHTGQGFSPLNSQLKGTATTPALASRTLNATALANSELLAVNLNTVQPQVCVTCHSPHNPGTKSGLTGSIVALAGYDPTYGTTFAGNTPLLPAGFQAAGVGKGALCIVCHESRNGEPVAGAGNPTLHEDGDANWDPTVATNVITRYQEPHDAAQGDVLMGRNAYFVTGTRSPHSLIADTCVNCHMELMPAPNDLDPARLGTNHNFAVNLDVANICANCHQFSGGQIQDAFIAQYNATLQAVTNKIYYIKTYSLSAGAAPHFPAADGATVTLSIVGGTPNITVTGSSNAAANTTGTVTLLSYLSGVTYKGVTYGSAPNIVIPAIYKSVWNLMLVNNDSSEGIHNPGFEMDVLQQTFIKVSVF